MRTEITTARTVGGEASTALMNTRNVRQRDRVNRRMVASVIRRLCLLRGERECDQKAMIYKYNRKQERAAWKGGRGTAGPSFLLAEASRSECAPSMRAVKDSLAAPLRAKWGN